MKASQIKVPKNEEYDSSGIITRKMLNNAYLKKHNGGRLTLLNILF